MAMMSTPVSPEWLSTVRELASQHTQISPGMIFRRLRIPSPAGEALLQELQEEGLVGPRSPGGSREVLAHD